MSNARPDLTIDGLYQITVPEYNASPAMRQSLLKEIHKSPKAFKFKAENPFPSTPAMVLGTATHTMILEPDQAEDRIAIWSGASTRGKAYDEFAAKHEGKEILTKSMYEQARGMADSFASHPLTAGLLKGAETEASCFWQDFATEIDCKARFDLVRDGVLYDVKTTVSATESRFHYSAKDFDYRSQAAWYLDGMAAVTGERWERFVFICIEKDPPHDIQLFEADPYFLALGRARNTVALRTYAACSEENDWPGYSPMVKALGIDDRESMEIT